MKGTFSIATQDETTEVPIAVDRPVHSLNEGFANSEEMYRGFIENLPVLFYAVSAAAPYAPLYVSPAFARFGYPLDSWVNDPDIWLRVIHPEDREWVFSRTHESTNSGKEVDYEYRIVDANGALHWVRDRGCLIRDKNGTVICREGVMLDITDRVETEEALRIGESQYQNLFENANDIIYVHDLEGNYLSMNHSAEKIFGYSHDEAISLNMGQLIVPEHLAVAREQLQKKVADPSLQTAYEIDCVKKDGTRITLEVNSSAILKNGAPAAVQGIARDVTERKRAEERIRESENKYRKLFEYANDLIFTLDLNGDLTSLNHTGETITGYSRDELLGRSFFDMVARDSAGLAEKMLSGGPAEETHAAYEIDFVAKDGRHISLEMRTSPVFREGVKIGVQGIGRDITERKRANEALIVSEQRYRQLSEGICHQVWTARPDGSLDYVNERTLEYFQRESEQIIGEEWLKFVHPDDTEECMRKWTHSISTGELYECAFRLRRHDGVYRWHKARAICGKDANGSINKWFGTNTDFDDQKQSEERLNYYARHDTLTDLPNRVEFMSRLNAAIENANTHEAYRFAVLFLDLDRFKLINDSLGHIVGDKLLMQIAERLRKQVRPGDVVARLGGDEFTVLLNRTGSLADVAQVADRVQRHLSKPFMIDGYEVFTSASIGIIVSDDIVRQPEDFLRDADSAMYRAKAAGRARYEIFDREMHAQNLNQLEIETDLRHAVERNEFELLYQPIVDLETGSINEFEALLRWEHPRYGLIGPDDFVAVAEECGLITSIGKWTIEKACRQIADLQERSGMELSISVNLSARQLMHPMLTREIVEILQETGLKASQLKLEVTESMVMEHSESSLNILSELSEIGVSLSTDDFGTGYSSLSYLRQFPFNRLKVDRSFVMEMENDAKSAAIVKTILMLGNNLGIEVVAEGIETINQLDKLSDMGFQLGQGFYFSHPVTAEKAEEILSEQKRRYSAEPKKEIQAAAPIYQISNLQ